MKKYFKATWFQLLLFFVVVLSACSKDESAGTPERTLYNEVDDKLWAHRINTAVEAEEALKVFKGIETDVYFVEELNEFQTGHDYPSGRGLETFFDSIKNCNQYKYWIDFKNLNSNNVDSSLAEMKRLIVKYNLENRVIVESSDAECLGIFRCTEIYTCYWVTELDVFIPYFAEDKLAKEVKAKIEKYNFDALSSNYEMNGFFQRHFSDFNIHLWTNTLKGKEGVEEIRKIATYPNVKVILVDYDRNFMVNYKQNKKN